MEAPGPAGAPLAVGLTSSSQATCQAPASFADIATTYSRTCSRRDWASRSARRHPCISWHRTGPGHPAGHAGAPSGTNKTKTSDFQSCKRPKKVRQVLDPSLIRWNSSGGVDVSYGVPLYVSGRSRLVDKGSAGCDNKFRHRIEVSWVQLHDVFVLNVICLVHEFRKDIITLKAFRIQRQHDPK